MTLYEIVDALQHLKTPLVVAGWIVVALVAYVAVILVGGASPVLFNVFMWLIGFEWDFWHRRWVSRFGRRPADKGAAQ